MAQTTGRAVPAPLTYTFPNGAMATLTRLSQFTIAKVEARARKLVPKPEAPLAPGVGGAMEPNPADPDYEATLAAWQSDVQNRTVDLLLDVAVEVDIDDQELEHLTRAMARIGEEITEVSDRVTYIKHCCFAGDPDLATSLATLASLISGRSAPTEADVQAHVDTFPGDVGGA